MSRSLTGALLADTVVITGSCLSRCAGNRLADDDLAPRDDFGYGAHRVAVAVGCVGASSSRRAESRWAAVDQWSPTVFAALPIRDCQDGQTADRVSCKAGRQPPIGAIYDR